MGIFKIPLTRQVGRVPRLSPLHKRLRKRRWLDAEVGRGHPEMHPVFLRLARRGLDVAAGREGSTPPAVLLHTLQDKRTTKRHGTGTSANQGPSGERRQYGTEHTMDRTLPATMDEEQHTQLCC